MGYYVRALPHKKNHPQWKIQFVSYKKCDIMESNAKKPKKEWDVPRERWRGLGFLASMAINEVKSRAKQLNSQAVIKRQEERLRQLELQELENQLKYNAFLPEEFKEEFELRFLRKHDSETKTRARNFSRTYILWHAAQKLIIHIKMDPSEWFDNVYDIYDYFYNQRFSMSYINKILRITNLWGFFIAKKLGKPFLPIPCPRGYERQRLIDAYYEKKKNKEKGSRPLSPLNLDTAKEKIKRDQYHWLYLTVWLGLRPMEIDNLKNRDLWRVEILSSGRKILWVFQTKIVSLPPQDRWKPIPILYDEQKFALRLIELGNFKRPLVKTVKKYFGTDISLYGGRKGFTDLMLEKGHSLEAISQWMGHSTLDRTWQSYKDRRGFKFSLPS